MRTRRVMRAAVGVLLLVVVALPGAAGGQGFVAAELLAAYPDAPTTGRSSAGRSSPTSWP